MQCAVEFAVAAPVEAVADRLAGGGWDWCGAGEPRERGLARKTALVGPGEQQLGGRQRTDAWLVEQLRSEAADELLDLPRELTLFGGQLQDASGDRAEGEQRCRGVRGRVCFRAGSRRAGGAGERRQAAELATERLGVVTNSA